MIEKKLFLLRHAKSSWKNLELDDHERPLSERGIFSCQVMATHIFKKLNFKDISIFSSNSKRTQETCKKIFKNSIKVNFESELYTFNFNDLIKWIKKIKINKNLMIVGHNPALIDLINYVAKDKIIKFPTCAFCEINLYINSWSEINKNTGEIKELQLVKRLKSYYYKNE